MSCEKHTETAVRNNDYNYIIIIVLYILLVIILGACLLGY